MLGSGGFRKNIPATGGIENFEFNSALDQLEANVPIQLDGAVLANAILKADSNRRIAPSRLSDDGTVVVFNAGASGSSKFIFRSDSNYPNGYEVGFNNNNAGFFIRGNDFRNISFRHLGGEAISIFSNSEMRFHRYIQIDNDIRLGGSSGVRLNFNPSGPTLEVYSKVDAISSNGNARFIARDPRGTGKSLEIGHLAGQPILDIQPAERMLIRQGSSEAVRILANSTVEVVSRLSLGGGNAFRQLRTYDFVQSSGLSIGSNSFRNFSIFDPSINQNDYLLFFSWGTIPLNSQFIPHVFVPANGEIRIVIYNTRTTGSTLGTGIGKILAFAI